MLSPSHRYSYDIGEDDPRAQQPEAIRIPLKPHQLASLHKAIVMEREGKISYSLQNPEEYMRLTYGRRPRYRGNYTIYSNLGVIGDIVGYGKTMVGLGIIAATPVANIHQENGKLYSYNSLNSNNSNSYIRVHMENIEEENNTRQLFSCTLVIVPRGPVYNQWKAAIKDHTTLRVLALDDVRVIRKMCPPIGATNKQLCDFFKEYDIVLIKNTSIETFIDYYNVPFQVNPIRGFQRIMVDEAHETLSKTTFIEYNFVWYITATYRQLTMLNRTANKMSSVAYEILSDEHVMNVLVKCDNDFTKKSFVIPSYREITHICKVPRMVDVVQPFLSTGIIELVNANDIEGAIRELGGSTETQDNIITALTRNIQRDIHNREKEKEYVEGIDIPDDAKASRLRTINEDLNRLQSRKADLEERIRTMTNDVCPICYDTLDAPVILSCTHTFCGVCIMKWVETNEKANLTISRVCPTCRTPITKKEDFIAIVKEKQGEGEAGNSEEKKKKKDSIMSKTKTISHIIRKRKEGKFIIFSEHDITFNKLYDELDNKEITYTELKGNTHQMEKALERFKTGEVRVILLNTKYAGSGIDISCATDIILYHSMNQRSDQAIGRAQRVGRTNQLTVHRLYYPHENR